MQIIKSNKNNRRILSILLLFLFSTVLSQQINIDNKNDFFIIIKYDGNKVKLNPEKNINIINKDITSIHIEYFNGKNYVYKDIPIFLKVNESLNLSISEKSIVFKGDKDKLHDLIVNQQHYILYKNITTYQSIYYKMSNTNEFIKYSHIILDDYLNKIKSENSSISEKDNERYKCIVKYVIDDWIASLFLVFLGSEKLDIKSKELTLYYYNKYIKKGYEDCEFKEQYNILRELAKYKIQLNISLPEYPIIESSNEDEINKFLPKSCQRYYFTDSFRYYNEINSPRKDFYKNILDKKFDE